MLLTQISKNGVAIAGFIVVAFGYFGIELEVESVVDFLAAVALAVTTGMAVWNQFSRSDVKWFFLKK